MYDSAIQKYADALRVQTCLAPGPVVFFFFSFNFDVFVTVQVCVARRLLIDSVY